MSLLNTLCSLWRKVPLRLAHIVEGSMSLQACCPVCPYHGPGRKDIFIAFNCKKVVVTCPACQTSYWSLR